jgi:release factor glutamine methyltransferase
MTYNELRSTIEASPDTGQIVLNELLKNRFDSDYVMMMYKLGDIELTTEDLDELTKNISRFNAGEPLQYITCVAHFYKNEFTVNRNVLIPRPETEELVDIIIQSYTATDEIKILEIGTGSGCIAISLSLHLKNAAIDAVDISKSALDVAILNNKILRGKVNFLELDFLDENTWNSLGKYDLIISNPPYIAESEKTGMNDSVIQYEPHIALFVTDNEPLIFYKKILEFGKTYLHQKGMVYAETSQYQHLDKYDGYVISHKNDMSGNKRFMIASLK